MEFGNRDSGSSSVFSRDRGYDGGSLRSRFGSGRGSKATITPETLGPALDTDIFRRGSDVDRGDRSGRSSRSGLTDRSDRAARSLDSGRVPSVFEADRSRSGSDDSGRSGRRSIGLEDFAMPERTTTSAGRRGASGLRSLRSSDAIAAGKSRGSGKTPPSLFENADLRKDVKTDIDDFVVARKRGAFDGDGKGGKGNKGGGKTKVDVDVDVDVHGGHGNHGHHHGHGICDEFWLGFGFATAFDFFHHHPCHPFWYGHFSHRFHDHFWFHFNFGYFPIYSHYAYPVVQYVPSTTYVEYPVYVPVYPDVAPTVLPADAYAVPPELSDELARLDEGDGRAVELLESGAAAFKRGEYAEAVDAFRKAMLAEPNNAVPKFALAHALFAVGEYDYAVFLIRRGMELLPEWPKVGTSLHELYGDADDLAEQTIALRLFSDENADDLDARFLLAYVSYFSGDLDRAEDGFRGVVAADPDDEAADAFVDRIGEIRAEMEKKAY